MNCEELYRYLQPLVDGELGVKETLDAEAHLATCPRCRELLQRERAFKETVGRSLGSQASPAHLRRAILRKIERPLRLSMAAGVAILLLASGWIAYLQIFNLPQDIILETLANHERAFYRESPAEVRDEKVLEIWFTERLPYHVRLPRFRGAALETLGGRLCHLGETPAAYLRYRSQGESVSLFVVASGGAGLPRWGGVKVKGNRVHSTQRGNYRVLLWSQKDLIYSLASSLSVEGMLALLEHSL